MFNLNLNYFTYKDYNIPYQWLQINPLKKQN